MNIKKLPIGWAILAIVLLGAVGFLLAYVSAANSGNRYEQNLKASFTDSQNVLGKLEPQLKEALGVTRIQANAVRDIVTGANQSRYGTSGSQAATQLIQESNPNLDQASYGRIITLIEAARNDFTQAQTRTVDQNRLYKIAVGTMPNSFFYRLAGYPTADYYNQKYDDIVISNHAGDAFQTRRDSGIDLSNFQ